MSEERVHVDRALRHDPLQHGVQQDEGSGATHARTAVHQHGLLVLVVLPHSADEPDEGRGIVGHAMVRPAQEQEVGHLQLGQVGLGCLRGERETLTITRCPSSRPGILLRLTCVTMNVRIS